MKNCRYCSSQEVETDLGICQTCQERVLIYQANHGGNVGLVKYSWSHKYRPGLNADADRFEYFRQMEADGRMRNLKPKEKKDIEAWHKHLKARLDI